jgi:6-pyruvoyltetrahydropterin/6-carboxytetrahydropterin synthase
MVMNITDLKQAIKRVLDTLDHRNLDLDVEFFRTRPSTTENLSVYVWHELKKELRGGSVELYEIRIHETKNNVAVYRGD